MSFSVAYHSHHRNNGQPPLMCHQRWRLRGCRYGGGGVMRRTVRLREALGSENGRKSEPAGGPEDYGREKKKGAH